MSSVRAPCVPPLFGVKVPPRADCGAEERPWEVFRSHSRSNELCAVAGFGCHPLGLCVTSVQRNNNSGLDGTFPSSNFAELRIINFWKNQASLSGCHPWAPSATPVEAGCASAAGKFWQIQDVANGPNLSGKGVCTVPVAGGCSSVTQHGRGRMDRTTVLYTLHWPQRKWCSLAPR